jgi:hypothetical protein
MAVRVFLGESAGVPVSVPRIGPAAAHVAAITFYPYAGGFAPIAPSHVELVAGASSSGTMPSGKLGPKPQT